MVDRGLHHLSLLTSFVSFGIKVTWIIGAETTRATNVDGATQGETFLVEVEKT